MIKRFISETLLKKEEFWQNYFSNAEGVESIDSQTESHNVALHISEQLSSMGVDDYVIVEGWLFLNENDSDSDFGYPEAHFWVELSDGTIIDPCCLEWWGMKAISVKRVEDYAKIRVDDHLYEYFENREYTASEFIEYVESW